MAGEAKFSTKHPFWYDVIVFSAGIVIGGITLSLVNTYVMPKLSSFLPSSSPASVASTK